MTSKERLNKEVMHEGVSKAYARIVADSHVAHAQLA